MRVILIVVFSPEKFIEPGACSATSNANNAIKPIEATLGSAGCLTGCLPPQRTRRVRMRAMKEQTLRHQQKRGFLHRNLSNSLMLRFTWRLKIEGYRYICLSCSFCSLEKTAERRRMKTGASIWREFPEPEQFNLSDFFRVLVAMERYESLGPVQ